MLRKLAVDAVTKFPKCVRTPTVFRRQFCQDDAHIFVIKMPDIMDNKVLKMHNFRSFYTILHELST